MSDKVANKSNTVRRTYRLGPWAAFLALVWTVIVGLSLAWNLNEQERKTKEVARVQARAGFEKDVLYRRWNAMLGGVYAPVTETTKSSPAMNVPERDIQTTSGQTLTLINPAYMSRQVYELGAQTDGTQGHLTSLNPIRPQNAADPWETEALEAFERGEPEYSSVEVFRGEPHMRLMRPLITEKGCLTCHAVQGYQEGDIRGGISVSVPLATLRTIGRATMISLAEWHGFFWVLGLGGIGVSYRQRAKSLRESNEQLQREIVDRERVQDELAQARKLESIGHLAAGIAHEINTPAQYVGDNIRFLKDVFIDTANLLGSFDRLLQAAKLHDVTEELIAEVDAVVREVDADYLAEEAPKAIGQSLEGIDRVAEIVQAMKDFSCPSNDWKQAIDLNRAIQSTLTVSRNEWNYVAELVTDFAPNPPFVPCLPADFNQVILNLVVNAAHAITDVVGDGSAGKGTLTVRTRYDGDWAEIHIEDTGGGIPEDARENVFDPFFTTKDVGKGTGQGLTIAHSVVVEKHGGTIAFETESGKGTTFIVRLPITESPASEQNTQLKMAQLT